MTQENLRLSLALGLFVSEDLTLAQAAQYAGITRDEFQKKMEECDLHVHYGVNELHEDMETLRKAGL